MRNQPARLQQLLRDDLPEPFLGELPSRPTASGKRADRIGARMLVKRSVDIEGLSVLLKSLEG